MYSNVITAVTDEDTPIDHLHDKVCFSDRKEAMH